MVFVCGSSGLVAVSSRSGRRLSASAVRAAGLRAVSCVGGVWLPVWRVRGSLASLRAVLRGRRLSALRRLGLRLSALRRAGVRAECVRPGVVVRAARVVVRRVFGLRAVRLGLRPLRFSLRRRGGFPGVSFGALVRACWRGLPPRACGRAGCVRLPGGGFGAWLCVSVVRGGRVVWAFWAPGRVAAGWPVVGVGRGGGGGGGGRRPAVVAPSVFSASGGGSVLWCSAPAVVSAVASGVCPLSLALRVFRWPVRSAVLWALWACLSSPRFAALGVPRGLVADLVSACLSSLGWRFSPSRSVRGLCRGAFRGSSVGAFLASRSCSVALPAVPLSWAVSASFSASAVVSALRSVVRCLGWLASRSSGGAFCPPALRGVVASVARAGLFRLGR